MILRRNHLIVAFVLVIFATLIWAGNQESLDVSKRSPVQYVDTDHKQKRETSIIAILADPWRFHGIEVEVRGFVAMSRGPAIITYNEMSCKKGVSADLIYIDYTQCTNSDVLMGETTSGWRLLKGTIDASRGGITEQEYYSCVLRVKELSSK